MTQDSQNPTPVSQMQSARRRGLGRGLDALFENAPKATPEDTGAAALAPSELAANAADSSLSAAGPGVETAAGTGTNALARQVLPITALQPGTYQPRRVFHESSLDELATSIAKHGILQPLLVRPLKDQAGRYEIIAGERRWRAAQRARLHDVPVVINTAMSDRDALQIGLIENLQREDLTPFDEAAGYQRLMDEFHFTPERLGEQVGKSRAHIANTIRLLQLPQGVRALVIQGKLSAGHARALIGVPTALAVAEHVVAKGLSVRATEKLAEEERNAFVGTKEERRARGLAKKQKSVPPKDMHVLAAEKTMSDSLGLAVTLVMTNPSRGNVQIDFSDLDQLDLIIKRLTQIEG